jgi:DNA transformation protein
MQTDLAELKNLGNTSINWLRVIGIHNRQELDNMGAAGAYLRIKQRGIKVSKVLLYALHGALIDTHWNELNTEQKQQLLDQVEEISDSLDEASA